MSAPLAWLALAGAIALSGSAGRRQTRQTRPARHMRSGEPAPVSTRTLAGLAGFAVALCSLLLAGGAGLPLAAVLAPAAAAGVRWLAARPATGPPDGALALALDLTAAALRAGQSAPAAFALTVPVLPPVLARRWEQAAGLLALGAGPDQAWAALAAERALAPVAAAARRSADSGARLARALEQAAAEVRAEVHSAALARAARAGVLAMAPLGLCFLPAFVCLGIVPTVAGIAHDVLPGR